MTSPASEDTKLAEIKIEKEESKYFNREERDCKHNFCGVCKKDGALIYCKNCSASYHLQCHIPAANPTDVFNQQWLCYICREFKRNFLETNRKSIETNDKINRNGKKRSALEILAFAASLVNPREFELPKELQSLSITYSESTNVDYVSDRKVKKDHCLDSDLMVPLPIRMCFQCGRSCRKAPLIACDYCPLYFHQDCLDPPLIAFPIGRWVCPNHPNHLDQDLLTSCKIRNRIKLWDRYCNQSIDQHSIKLDFVHKYTVNSLIRTKVRLEGRPRIKVPSSIKFHYKNRSSLDSLRFCQNSFLWPSKNVVSDDEQHIDCEETDNSKIDNCIEDKQIERINEVKKERKECDAITNEENQQKASDVNECTSKVENKIATDNSKECNNLEFHIEYCDHNVKEGIELLERPVLEALAQERLEQILNPHGDNYEKINCRKRASAALFSLNPKPNPPAFMTRRTFVIGNGSDCDLVLSNYGSCKFTSSKHAIIFFDEATKCYELLNYSEHGTVVDNVLYSCDCMPDEEEKTDKSITKKEKTSKLIKTILHKNEIVSLQEYAYAHKSDKILCKCSIKCNTRVSKHLEEGWEGSAIIAHGSILNFGCLMFVFNTLDVFING